MEKVVWLFLEVASIAGWHRGVGFFNDHDLARWVPYTGIEPVMLLPEHARVANFRIVVIEGVNSTRTFDVYLSLLSAP